MKLKWSDYVIALLIILVWLAQLCMNIFIIFYQQDKLYDKYEAIEQQVYYINERLDDAVVILEIINDESDEILFEFARLREVIHYEWVDIKNMEEEMKEK